ncbi:universal stress protein [Candidatus Nitrotoga arctica]|uniref:UspA domain-containing protein n=1 Tax=Candidatus Nitrotoga arctica TaxID=453162 RepID=A0ABN8AKG7_9PROT|nr:universal stress protein [Candidatus Nitrotoga arctica]CAG9932066.1 protein of unknown function [Candidatus Nitrotoga arctica]
MTANYGAGDVEVAETGGVTEDVASCLKRYGADLVVMGAHELRGVRTMMIGSVSEARASLTEQFSHAGVCSGHWREVR